MLKTSRLNKIVHWREKYVSQHHFILFLSLLVGFLSALAAHLLKIVIHSIQHFLTNSIESVGYLYLLFPFIGITLSYLFIKYIVKDDISHGVTRILFAISQRKSIVKLHNIWTSLVGSAVTIGFGGSVGAESPIVLTGSAIGSNLGNIFRLDQKTLMLLVGCGSAGAIAGIFKAPITGLIFTLEVLMLDMTMTSIVPIIISSVTATAVSYFLSDSSFLFNFTSHETFDVHRIPQIVILGVVCGFVSLYFTRSVSKLEMLSKKIKNPWVKLLIGGTVLGVLLFVFPPLYGEGYTPINQLINGDINAILSKTLFHYATESRILLLLFLILIIVFKSFALVSTTSPGGVGGMFAPSLFVGSITGFLISTIFKDFNIDAPTSNFVLAGMAGLLSGVMHAPLTGIFLIAELTGGYTLFMTLMIVSVISYLTIIVFEPHSLYTIRLARKGKLLTHNKDRNVLTLLSMEEVIETDFCDLKPNDTLECIVKVISKSKRNVFPVLEEGTQRFIGLVLLDEVRNIMFRPELYNRFTAEKLMISAPAKVNINMSMGEVMTIFEDTNAWNLPVVDDNGKYVGFISKSKIFNAYRKLLVGFSDD